MKEIRKPYQNDFEYILGMIQNAKVAANYQANMFVIEHYWSIGKYVCEKTKNDG